MKNQTIDELILVDHDNVRGYYQEYLKATLKDDRWKWVNMMVHDIAVHSIAEEIALYPLLRKYLLNGDIIVDSNINEHQKVKELLYDITKLDENSPLLDVKLTEMMKNLEKHMSLEEKDELPEFIQRVSLDERMKAGKTYSLRKKLAPTKPHVNAPSKDPNAITLVGLLTKPIDAFRDLFTEFPSSEEVSSAKKCL